MGNIIGNLTQGELVQVLGRLFQRVGERMDAGDFKDGVQASEVFDEVQKLITDLLSEFSDSPE